MKKTNCIFKYTLNVQEEIQKLKLPYGAEVLKVGLQHDELRIWVMFERHEDPALAGMVQEREFLVCGTGCNFDTPHAKVLNYLGSTVGDFVWHVFECVDEENFTDTED